MKEKRKIALRIPASSYIMHCILFILLKVWMKEKTFLFFSSSVSGHSTRFNLSSDFEGKKGSKDRILQHGAFKSWEKNLKVIISIVNLATPKQKLICFTYHAFQQGGLFSKCPFFFTFAHTVEPRFSVILGHLTLLH